MLVTIALKSKYHKKINWTMNNNFTYKFTLILKITKYNGFF